MGLADPTVETEAPSSASGLLRARPPALVTRAGIQPLLVRETVYRRLLVVADVVAMAAAVWISGSLVAGASVTLASVALIPLVVGLAKVFELYDRDVNRLRKVTLDELPDLLLLASVVTLICDIAGTLIFSESLGAAGVAALWASLPVLLLTGRGVARAIADRITPPERCLFVGDPLTAAEFERKLIAQRANAHVVATVVPPPRGRRRDDHEHERAELVASILPTIEREEVQRVIIASGPWDSEDFLHSLEDIKALGVRLSVLPSISRLATFSFDVDQLPGMALLGMRSFAISRSSDGLKRSFDVLVSSLLVLLLSPLLIVVAIAIKLESRGSVFFHQERVGRDGRKFQILKFRSMVDGADRQKEDMDHPTNGNGLFKLQEDPRVTRVGRVIRRLSIDELPQLLNVLRGEMSLVGPRPLVPHEDAMIQGHHRVRLNMRPGLTGHWQILGSLKVPLDDMVTLDYMYVANWSLWMDLKIIARTIPYLVTHGNV